MEKQKKILAAYGVDVSCFEEYFGDLAFYEECFRDLMSSPYFTLLHDAIACGDCSAAFEAAHALKGVAGNLHLKTLYEDDCKLVEALRMGDMHAAAAPWARVAKDWYALQGAEKELRDA